MAPATEVSSHVIQGPRNPIEYRRPAGNGAERPECAAEHALRHRAPDAGNSVGSRHAATCSVIAISSVLAGSFAKSLRKEGMVSAGMYGRASTFKISCSVTADLVGIRAQIGTKERS